MNSSGSLISEALAEECQNDGLIIKSAMARPPRRPNFSKIL